MVGVLTFSMFLLNSLKSQIHGLTGRQTASGALKRGQCPLVDWCLPIGLGIEQVDEIAVPINNPINLSGLSCLGFCCPVGRGSAVLGLVVPVVAELVTPLDAVFRCAHYWSSNQ